MAPKVMLLLGACALLFSQVESVYQCNPDNRDCFCTDFSYRDCLEPVGTEQIHTANLEECIFQCDLFASFGACDWLLFDQTDGMDNNCHIFAAVETIDEYINSCNLRGHPTRDTDNKCYIDSTTAGADLFCKARGAAGRATLRMFAARSTRPNAQWRIRAQTTLVLHQLRRGAAYFVPNWVSMGKPPLLPLNKERRTVAVILLENVTATTSLWSKE